MSCDRKLNVLSRSTHGGHFIPKKTRLNTRYDENNVYLQCIYCNLYDKEMAHIKMTIKIIKYLGIEWVDKLVKKSEKKIEREIDDYNQMIEKFRMECIYLVKDRKTLLGDPKWLVDIKKDSDEFWSNQ